ncbi:MAG: transposase [Actinobacteria bacterium]|nr:transposase [Actinomycetota bacterium]
MTTFIGLDLHRAQITYDALDTATGETKSGRIRPANRETVRAFLARYSETPTVVAVEAMTGWRFVAEECALAGVGVRLAEPAETRLRQDRKRRAKTDKLDARLLRELLMQDRLPESWIPPAHILDLRVKVRLRKTVVGQRTEWLQRIHAVLFHHGVPVQAGRLGRLEGRYAHEQLADLELPEAAQQQITVALGIIEHLNGVLHDLDLELARIARRQPGCRALMAHYGIGSRVATAIVAELGDTRRLSSSGANRAALTIARKLLRRAHHTLRELGDDAIAPAT